MTNDELLTSLAEQLAVLAEGVEALIDHQRSLAEKIDEQAASLAAIGTAVGLTYLATDAERPLPVDVLEDRAFARRSEEHTSELQSLMRISYAVFCLKKKQH